VYLISAFDIQRVFLSRDSCATTEPLWRSVWDSVHILACASPTCGIHCSASVQGVCCGVEVTIIKLDERDTTSFTTDALTVLLVDTVIDAVAVDDGNAAASTGNGDDDGDRDGCVNNGDNGEDAGGADDNGDAAENAFTVAVATAIVDVSDIVVAVADNIADIEAVVVVDGGSFAPLPLPLLIVSRQQQLFLASVTILLVVVLVFVTIVYVFCKLQRVY